MKNSILLLFFVFAAACVAAFTYFNTMQERSAERIEASLLNQFDHWTKTYDSLRENIEYKKQMKLFLEQQEYNRQLQESVTTQLGNFTTQQEGLKLEFTTTLAKEQDALRQNFAASLEKQQQESASSLGELSKQFEAFKTQTSDAQKQLQAALDGLRQDSQRNFEEARKEIAGYKEELVKANKRFEDAQAEIAQLRSQLKEYAQKQQRLETVQAAQPATPPAKP